MALPVQRQLQYWGLAAAGFLLLLWFLNSVILPFVLGAAIAYLLDPLADGVVQLSLEIDARMADRRALESAANGGE